jgi:hypothetical protein
VLAQGGLAPLAVMLAARESDDWRGHQAIAAIVLASPPEWSTLANGLDDGEVVRNFELLSASIGSPSPLGTLCYRTLCARPFVRFFSVRARPQPWHPTHRPTSPRMLSARHPTHHQSRRRCSARRADI